MIRVKNILFVLMISIVVIGCGKEPIALSYAITELSLEEPLNDILFVNADTGYLVVGKIFNPGKVYQTTDGSTTWELIYTSDQQTRFLYYDNTNLYIGEHGNAIRKRINGNNGENIIMPSWDEWNDMVVLSNGEKLVIGGRNFGEGHTHRLTANNEFIERWNIEQELTSVVQTADGTLHLTSYGALFKSTDNALNWIPSTTRGDFYKKASFPTNEVGYVVGLYGSVLKTVDNGDTWQKIQKGSTLGGTRLRDVQFVDENKGCIIGDNGLIWFTQDGGDSWQKDKAPLDENWVALDIMNDIAIIASETGTILKIDLNTIW